MQTSLPPFLDRLRQPPPLIADGAMGTMLFTRGLEPGACPEALALSRPELLEAVAREYVAAGAQIVQTNTFGASPLRLAAYGLDAQAAEINRLAIAAARRGAGDGVYVSGSCGPSGRLLAPYGDTDPAALRASFIAQLRAMLAAGADLVCVETMTDLTEATIAVRAAKELSPATPVVATMSFDPTPRGYYTIMGASVAQAAGELAAAGADVVGSNCGNGIERMIEIARAFRAATALPLLIQANAGLPEYREGELVYPETPAFMAEQARALVEAGVAVIGGCCGTTPAHIRALREMVDGAGG